MTLKQLSHQIGRKDIGYSEVKLLKYILKGEMVMCCRCGCGNNNGNGNVAGVQDARRRGYTVSYSWFVPGDLPFDEPQVSPAEDENEGRRRRCCCGCCCGCCR